MLRHQHRQELDATRAEANRARQEALAAREEAEAAREAADNSPSSVLKALVERLKRDLADKEKRSKAMARAIAELKRELLEQAAAVPPQEEKIERTGTGRPEAETAASLRRRVEDLNARNSKLQKQVRALQEGESSYYRQVKALKEELSQKGVMLVRTNEGGLQQQRGRIRVASGSLIEQVSSCVGPL